MFIDNYSRYRDLYLIREKSQSLNRSESFNVKVENQLCKKIKGIKSGHDGKYYGQYGRSSEQLPRSFD